MKTINKIAEERYPLSEGKRMAFIAGYQYAKEENEKKVEELEKELDDLEMETDRIHAALKGFMEENERLNRLIN